MKIFRCFSATKERPKNTLYTKGPASNSKTHLGVKEPDFPSGLGPKMEIKETVKYVNQLPVTIPTLQRDVSLLLRSSCAIPHEYLHFME